MYYSDLINTELYLLELQCQGTQTGINKMLLNGAVRKIRYEAFCHFAQCVNILMKIQHNVINNLNNFFSDVNINIFKEFLANCDWTQVYESIDSNEDLIFDQSNTTYLSY